MTADGTQDTHRACRAFVYETMDYSCRAVGAAVVGDHYLREVRLPGQEIDDLLKSPADAGLLIVGGDDDGEERLTQAQARRSTRPVW